MAGLRVSLWIFYYMLAFSIFMAAPFFGLLFVLPPVWGIHTANKREKAVQRLKSWKEHKPRVVLTAVLVALAFSTAYSNGEAERNLQLVANYPVPVIEVTSATGDQGDATTYLLQFTAQDADSVTVNGSKLDINASGVYEEEMTLTSASLTVNIKTTNEYKEDSKSIVVTRNQTPEEIAEAERKAEERLAEIARKEEAAEAARLEAEAKQRAWEQSKAGKICSRHPEWTDETCKDVADGKIWIGMEYDMLVEERGNPRSTNPSNYGYGTQMQWCWSWDYEVSCFYDNNDDGIIDSYN